MKILLVGINAKYSHTNLAIRQIAAALKLQGVDAQLAEYTINHSPEAAASQIYLQSPDVIGFSCYIWNITFIRQVSAILQRLLPESFIFFGGPEAYNNAPSLLSEGLCSAVIMGEGEPSTPALIAALTRGDSLSTVPGLCYLQGGELVTTPLPPYFDLDLLPLPYQQQEELDNRIIYYESSRGCPYRCSYCLSATDKVLRYRSLPLVLEDLKDLLSRRVMQVKFIDRSFNCDPKRALEILRFIAQHDNSYTGFHFEVNAEALSQELIALLQSLRPSLVQLEIGLQSTHPPTLAAIQRSFHPAKMTQVIQTLAATRNIHLHLDLIAGLPYEGYSEFQQSFDYLFSLRPTMIQLGFLKVLLGSPLGDQAQQYGILYNPAPPYEVLSTPWLSHKELLCLKQTEAAVELYYNSGRYTAMLELLLQKSPSPFGLYASLGQRLLPEPISVNHGGLWYYDTLYSVGLDLGCDPNQLAWACRIDLYTASRPKKLPDFAQPLHQRSEIYDEIRRICSLPPAELCREYFIDFIPQDLQNPDGCYVLTAFDYNQRDIQGRASMLPVADLQCIHTAGKA